MARELPNTGKIPLLLRGAKRKETSTEEDWLPELAYVSMRGLLDRFA